MEDISYTRFAGLIITGLANFPGEARFLQDRHSESSRGLAAPARDEKDRHPERVFEKQAKLSS